MPSSRAALASLVALTAWSCTWSGRDDLAVRSVAPGLVPNHLDVELQIEGSGFEPEVKVDFDDPAGSDVDAGLSVALVRGSTRVPLVGTVRSSATTLRSTLPAGAQTGTWDVEVRGPGGSSASLARSLVVYLAEVSVTTSIDELDAGGTPWAPGGSGLSLREAVAFVNAEGTPTVITLAAPLTITMTGSLTGMTLTSPGAAVVGEPGVVLDFAGNKQSCITLAGPGQRLAEVTLQGCEGAFVKMSSASAGSQVAAVTFLVTTGARYWAYGVEAEAMAATSRIGPGNDLSGLWIALKVDGANYEITGNRVHDNGLGLQLSGDPARVWQNTFSGQVTGPSLRGIGVDVGVGPGPIAILNNVFHGNGETGLTAAAVGQLSVRNNLFTANAARGLDARTGLQHDHNGYFGNASGPVSANLSTGTTDLLLDPLYVDAAGGDWRLQAGSPAIDKGVDLGLDLNGDAAGLFTGLAPDLGASERW